MDPLQLRTIGIEQWTRLKRVILYLASSTSVLAGYRNKYGLEKSMKLVQSRLFFQSSILLKDEEGSYWLEVKTESGLKYISEKLELDKEPVDRTMHLNYCMYEFLSKTDVGSMAHALGCGLALEVVDLESYRDSKDLFKKSMNSFSCPDETVEVIDRNLESVGYYFTTVQNVVWKELLTRWKDLRDQESSVAKNKEIFLMFQGVKLSFCSPFPGRGVNPEIKRYMIEEGKTQEDWSHDEWQS